MDTVITKKSKFQKKHLGIAITIVMIIVIYAFLALKSEKVLYQNVNRLMIASVEEGEFEDFVTIRGNFESAVSVHLDAVVGGRVEQVLVEDGSHVKKDQLLVRFSNASMQIDLLANEARITEQLNDIRAQELNLERNRIEHLREIANIEHKIITNERKLKRLKQLNDKGVLAIKELEEAQDDLNYYKKLIKIARDSQKSDLMMQKHQLKQLKSSTEHLEKGLAFARENFNNLNVKAPVDGKLTAFDVSIGQGFNKGDPLGRIDDPVNFKVSSFVDEFYLSRIQIGQQAVANIGGNEFSFKVKKTYPNISNGQAKIDLVFDDTPPKKLRSGQTLQMKLFMGDTEQTKRIPNGSYFADTGGNWIFVVDDDNENAYKRKITTGRSNNSYIEVLDGLEVGEKVVVSPYTNYLDVNKIILNKTN